MAQQIIENPKAYEIKCINCKEKNIVFLHTYEENLNFICETCGQIHYILFFANQLFCKTSKFLFF